MTPTKADTAAAERVLKRAVAKVVARLRDADDKGSVIRENEWTFIVAIDAADMLVEVAS